MTVVATALPGGTGSLAVMDFDINTKTFSNYRVIATPTLTLANDDLLVGTLSGKLAIDTKETVESEGTSRLRASMTRARVSGAICGWKDESRRASRDSRSRRMRTSC